VAHAIPPDAAEIEQGRGLDRVIAFSDGVFAIAITLLVLNFKLPEVSGPDLDQQLFDAIADDWGLWFSFALSFAIIARFWVVHHRLSMLLRKIDTTFLVLNLVLLAFVVVLPYPTEILGEYGNQTAVAIYAAAMAFTGLSSALVWEHARRSGLMDPRVDPAWVRHSTMRGFAIPVVFLVSIPLVFLGTEYAQVFWLSVFVLGVVFRRRYGDIHQPFGTAEDHSP
jgi:uncharacterized membrane protein